MDLSVMEHVNEIVCRTIDTRDDGELVKKRKHNALGLDTRSNHLFQETWSAYTRQNGA